MTPPKLTLAIITGNVGIPMMKRFLDCFQPFFDEVVVVRAIGASEPDGTLDYAGSRGCITDFYGNTSPQMSQPIYNEAGTMCHTYYIGGTWPHVDDFSEARNRAFDLAYGRGAEFVMWLDTDDRVEPGVMEKFRKLYEQNHDKVDLFRLPYFIPEQGISLMRERVLRKGAGRWVSPVHEYIAPMGADGNPIQHRDGTMNETEAPEQWRIGDLHQVQIIHDPGEENRVTKDDLRNLRILQAIPEEQLTTSHRYHLFQEHFARDNKDDAVRHGTAFLESAVKCVPERYEVALFLSHLATTPEEAEHLRMFAQQIDPTRREAYAELAIEAMNRGEPKKALGWLRSMRGQELTADAPWNIRRKLYAWAGDHLYWMALRLTGQVEHAEALEFNAVKAGGAKISLLHATRGRPEMATKARMIWMDRAKNAEAIEHIFALDQDDETMPLIASRFRHLILAEGGGPVAAWNAAALMSCGRVLVQMSDDWIPPLHWDELILQRLDEKSGVLRISDGHRDDGLLCMAICTRDYWHEKLGRVLFHPAFFSMFSDNWFTEQAQRNGAIIEAPDIVFEHQHPFFGKGEMDQTYADSNRLLNFALGENTFRALKDGRDPFVWSQVKGWGNVAQFHEEVIQHLPENYRAVEIGVAYGRSFSALAIMTDFLNRQRGQRCMATAVDHFRGDEGAGHDPAFEQSFNDAMRAACVPHWLDKLPSIEASGRYEDESLDYVFIDASHDYANVAADITAWWPKVKPGGIIAGHDYRDAEGVRRAVDERGWKQHENAECWIYKKP